MIRFPNRFHASNTPEPVYTVYVPADDGKALFEEFSRPVPLEPGERVLRGELGRIEGIRLVKSKP